MRKTHRKAELKLQNFLLVKVSEFLKLKILSNVSHKT
jgi:hypothetical protein